MASPDHKLPLDRKSSGLDQVLHSASSKKPLTPFSIADILSKAPAKRSGVGPSLQGPSLQGPSLQGPILQGPILQGPILQGPSLQGPSLQGPILQGPILQGPILQGPILQGPSLQGPSVQVYNLQDRSLLSQTSPLCALKELASKTFRGLEVGVLEAVEGPDCLTLFGNKNAPKKCRKSRTAFTHHQIYQLEKRFLHQKYLSPADRDRIARQLGLTNAQVITWFQNRRAKLKRDLEEMRADVESTKAVGAVAFDKLSRLAQPERCATRGPGGNGEVCVTGYASPHLDLDLEHVFPGPLPRTTDGLESCRPDTSPSPDSPSRSEDEEIDVDDSSWSVWRSSRGVSDPVPAPIPSKDDKDSDWTFSFCGGVRDRNRTVGGSVKPH